MDVVELVDRKVDLARRKVWQGDAVVPLTDQEAALLAYLVARPGQVVPRDELLERVWGYAESVVTRAVDAAVRRLRNKIEADPADPVHLLTVHGVGYRFAPVETGVSDAPASVVVVVDYGDALRDLEPDVRDAVVVEATRSIEASIGRHGGAALSRSPESVEVGFGLGLSAARFALAIQLDLHRMTWPEGFSSRPRRRDRVDDAAWSGLLARVGLARDVGARAIAERLCGEARGGQILAERALVDDLGEPAELAAIATPRLDDDVVQLLPVELASRRFPDRSGPRVPEATDRFVGRQDVLAELERAVDEHRLVTLTGPGGVGKTRLATELARRWSDEGRAWLCDLTAAAGLDELVAIVAEALGIALPPVDTDTAVHAVGLALAGRGSELVVLDDFERFAEYAVATVAAWAAAAPAMTFVVTSRIRLGLPRERVIEVRPLTRAEALALFEARVPPGNVLADDERSIIGQIVEQVDRLPLAIELAAARTRVLAPLDLLEHLSASVQARFAVLRESGAETGVAAPRSASLWGSLDASWQLLEPAEREALGRCAVFRGAFDLAAAIAVLPPRPHDPFAAGDLLDRLRDRSLVGAHRGPTGRVRFTMLPTVRDHAWSRLDEHARGAALALHRAHYARLGTDEALVRMYGPDALAWIEDRRADVPDLLAALHSATEEQEPSTAVPLARILGAVSGRTGLHATAAQAVDPVLDIVRSPADMSRVLVVQSALLDALGDPRALAMAAEAVVTAAEAGTSDVLAAAHMQLGRTKAHRGDELGGLEHFRDAREHARQAGDLYLQAQAIGALANVHSKQGDDVVSMERYHQADAILRRLGDDRGRALVAANIAARAADRGDLIGASEGYADAIAHFRASGEVAMVALFQCNLGNVLTSRGELDEAEPVLHKALATSREIGNERGRGRALQLLGECYLEARAFARAEPVLAEAVEVHRSVGDLRGLGLAMVARGAGLADAKPEEARQHIEAGLAIHRSIGDARSAAFALLQRARVDGRDGAFDEAQSALDEATELARKVDDELTLALVMARRGTVALDAGDRAEAERWWARATAARRSLGLGEASSLGRMLSELADALGHP